MKGILTDRNCLSLQHHPLLLSLFHFTALLLRVAQSSPYTDPVVAGLDLCAEYPLSEGIHPEPFFNTFQHFPNMVGNVLFLNFLIIFLI